MAFRTIAALLAVAIFAGGCSPDRDSVVGSWRVEIPYAWQDSFLKDHVVVLHLAPSGTCSLEETWSGGTERSECTWRVVQVGNQSFVELQHTKPDRERDVRYGVRRRVGGWSIQFSDSPDHPLRFKNVG